MHNSPSSPSVSRTCEFDVLLFGAECLVDEKLSRVTVVARTAAQIYSPRVWKRRNHLFQRVPTAHGFVLQASQDLCPTSWPMW
ncbi:hypothetical protein CEXT_289041 [Caerostris extrusa]|uniref:Uncharacterized protein n=1 Tax=Caerostris extrusa TaxID=172846 RepID=A0AAV4XZ45_CAEEX|nr:hypothetical protein CEXT_289041 [Caerostris extrusa]